MDKLTQYRNYVQQLITQRDHYQLINIGWHDEQRVHGCALHIDIKKGKIWLQYNGTEHHIAQELVALGVPKEDIVLGFQEPYKRQFTELPLISGLIDGLMNRGIVIVLLAQNPMSLRHRIFLRARQRAITSFENIQNILWPSNKAR